MGIGANSVGQTCGGEHIWQQPFSPDQLSMLGCGLIVILLFARDRFNRPTYDAGTPAPFARLPPQLLAPSFRFREGLRLYSAMMAGLYLAISVVGPRLASIPAFGLPCKIQDPSTWPLLVAAFLAGITAIDDNKILGRIEGRLRRIAHEHAFIPFELERVAFGLQQIDPERWLNSAPAVGHLARASELAALTQYDAAKRDAVGVTESLGLLIWRLAILIASIDVLEQRATAPIPPEARLEDRRIQLKDKLSQIKRDYQKVANVGEAAA
jgi:hypothetical protein